MTEILAWPPLLWMARVLLLILLSGGALVSALYFTRFLRPRHVLSLLRAELPTFRTFGASAEVLGQRIEANATLDTRRDEQLDVLNGRIEELARLVAELADTTEHLIPGDRDDGEGEEHRVRT